MPTTPKPEVPANAPEPEIRVEHAGGGGGVTPQTVIGATDIESSIVRKRDGAIYL
jgi:hypothetical protein